ARPGLAASTGSPGPPDHSGPPAPNRTGVPQGRTAALRNARTRPGAGSAYLTYLPTYLPTKPGGGGRGGRGEGARPGRVEPPRQTEPRAARCRLRGRCSPRARGTG